MTRHNRIPALIAIGATLAIGLGLFALTGQFKKVNAAQASLVQLEKEIQKGTKDGHVWLAYGERLRKAGARDPKQFDAASRAYQKALEFAPDLLEARLDLGLALGQKALGKDPKEASPFFEYVSKLSGIYPKIAVDLLSRPELRLLHADERWAPAAAGARAQAVD